VVGVDVMGRFDVGGWGGGLVWFGTRTSERARGLRIRLIIRLIIIKYTNFIINI
jgi:hypothetical protein